ncbi:MAG TPA: AraC family transcriptional regulator, partial [Clostridia bacterium]|nr:AraC family transcriptional regulator [Clostridia bacterium]
FEYANAPELEVYFEGNQQAEDYQFEVWLPVVKK